MNRTVTAAVALAVVCSGCVVRTAPVVTAPPPRVVVAPPPPVVVTTPPAVVVVAPPVLAAPPSVVLVPGTTVYTAPGISFNVFVYGGRYYSYYQGSWFVAQRAGRPWTAVAIDHVPTPVRAVPPHYYRVPPGRGHDHHRHHDRGHDHGKGHDRDRDHDRDHDRDQRRGGGPHGIDRAAGKDHGQPHNVDRASVKPLDTAPAPDQGETKAQAKAEDKARARPVEVDADEPVRCPPGQAKKGNC
jgi:hypothetical protein